MAFMRKQAVVEATDINTITPQDAETRMPTQLPRQKRRTCLYEIKQIRCFTAGRREAEQLVRQPGAPDSEAAEEAELEPEPAHGAEAEGPAGPTEKATREGGPTPKRRCEADQLEEAELEPDLAQGTAAEGSAGPAEKTALAAALLGGDTGSPAQPPAHWKELASSLHGG